MHKNPTPPAQSWDPRADTSVQLGYIVNGAFWDSIDTITLAVFFQGLLTIDITFDTRTGIC